MNYQFIVWYDTLLNRNRQGLIIFTFYLTFNFEILTTLWTIFNSGQDADPSNTKNFIAIGGIPLDTLEKIFYELYELDGYEEEKAGIELNKLVHFISIQNMQNDSSSYYSKINQILRKADEAEQAKNRSTAVLNRISVTKWFALIYFKIN